ncbi:MAG: hypothetical protein AB8G05_07215 [Oligoflexales bacterium]
MQRILTTIIFALIAASCKTKNKSASIIQPKSLVGGGGSECALNLTKVPNLPAVPAGALRVKNITVSTEFPGDEERVEFSVTENTNPDVIIYEGYKRSDNTKFAGAAFGSYNINPMIPDGPLSITAWACVEPTRKTGGSYIQKAYAGQKFLCGAPKEKTLANQNKSTTKIGFALASIDREIEQTCMQAYRKITSEANYKKAVKSKNEALINSILGLRSMKIGAFTAKCVAEGADLAATAEYASGLNLSVSNDGCVPGVDEEEVDDYISTTPPPVTDPVDFVLPPPSDEPDTSLTEEQTNGEETNAEETKEETPVEETVSAATTEDEAKTACKNDNVRREEMGVGGAEWDPQRGICFYFNNEKEVVNSIEPSIPKSEVPLEEIVSEPETQSKGGLSKGQKWGLSFFIIGGTFAAGLARYKYKTSQAAGYTKLTSADTSKEVDLLKQETDLKNQKAVYDNALDRADLARLTDRDKSFLSVLSRETDDRIRAQNAQADLEALETQKKNFNGDPKFADQIDELNNKINSKKSEIEWFIKRGAISSLQETEFASKKAEAGKKVGDLKRDIANKLGIQPTDTDFSEKLDRALGETDANEDLKRLSRDLDSWEDYRIAFNDVETLEGHTKGREYLEDMNKKFQTLTTNPAGKSTIDGRLKNFKANAKTYVLSDWKGKGVAAGVVAAIIGAGALTFGLAGNTSVDLAASEGETLSGLLFCKKQLIKRGSTSKMSKGCQSLVNR